MYLCSFLNKFMATFLCSAQVGKRYKFLEINTTQEVQQRLFSLGLCVCDEIIIQQKSLFGYTIKFAIMNFPEKIMIAMRNEDACKILVEEC
jgi:Fe2+ transport system protein FeoA